MAMKVSWAALALMLSSFIAGAGEVVLPYQSFGPQSMACKLIGMEWWQWDRHGDSRPRRYPVKVVVFWDQALEETRKKYPIQKDEEKDYRYLA